LEVGDLRHPVPWALEVARFLAPFLVAYAATKAILAIFHEQAAMVRMRFFRRHAVVCGLGEMGRLLATSLHEAGHRVVAVELNPDNTYVASVRARGIGVLRGDATDPLLLHRAGVGRAAQVFGVCGDDRINAEVAARCRELASNRSTEGLSCFCHIAEPYHAELLREREIEAQRVGAFRLEIFNVHSRGAQILTIAHALLEPRAGNAAPRLLIVGLGHLGECLTLQLARKWHHLSTNHQDRMLLTLVDERAEEVIARLRFQHPRIGEHTDLRPVAVTTDSAAFQRADFLFDANRRILADRLCVCLADEPKAVSAALSLWESTRESAVPIVLRTTARDGLAALLAEEASAAGDKRIKVFNLLKETCTQELLSQGTREVLARAIHQAYVREQEAKGETAAENPSLVPWDRLPETLRQANRRQADHIGIKLARIGCRIAPLRAWGGAQLTFCDNEIELLAELEHQRWMDDLLADGWRYAPVPKDPVRKTHPSLVPWIKSTEEDREKDREVIRALPDLLARVGFEIYRVRDSHRPPVV
jgi:hypothetical protein